MLLLACGPKSNLDTDGDSTSQDSSSQNSSSQEVTSQDVTSQGTTSQGTTSAPTTTAPTTTAPNPTSSATTDTGSVPLDFGTPPFCGDGACDEDELASCSCTMDCGGCSLPPGVQTGCPTTWTGGSAVTGMTTFGPLDGHTAFFGWFGTGDTAWSELRLYIYDAKVDLEAAKNDPFSGVHFSLKLSPPWAQPDWLNKGVVDGAVVSAGKSDAHQALLEITGTAGNWQQADPNDPPRLLGMIHPSSPDDPQPLEGPFDAAFCWSFVEFVIPE